MHRQANTSDVSASAIGEIEPDRLDGYERRFAADNATRHNPLLGRVVALFGRSDELVGSGRRH